MTTPEDEDRLDLNVQHTASPDEVHELEKEMGGGDATHKPEGTKPEGDDLDDLLDEEQSGTKHSEAELDAGTDAERQAIKERKRQERLNQRQRARQRIESLERQLANALAANQEIQQRVGNLENSNLGTQAAQLEKAAQETDQAEQAYSNIIAEATAKADGKTVADATKALIDIQRRKELIANARAGLQTQAKQSTQPRPLGPEAINHVKAFMAENPWYKGPKSADLDSQILSTIDGALFREGWDPRSPSYWTELKARAVKHLSHRFNGQSQQMATESNGSGYNAPDRRTQRSPVAGSSSTSSGGGESSTRFTLSPERVRAMKEAGFWDDPKKRQSMVKRYQEIDRQIANERRS